MGLESSTIAVWLQAAGYRTGYVGKYLNGYPRTVGPRYVPPGWDEWRSPVGDADRPRLVRLLQAALHRLFGLFAYTMNENGKLVSYGSAPKDYFTDVLAGQAVEFIRRGGGPFFLHVAPFAPTTVAPASRHREMFPTAQLPRTPSFNEPDVTDKPGWLRRQPALSAAQIARLDQLYRRRLQALQALDELVRTVIQTLAGTGQLERTFIFFSSDNGFHLGEHRLPDGKNTAYEEDIRVPLIVVGPGVVPGRTVSHLTANIDLASTWAELAGARADAFVDGRSLVPFLTAGVLPRRWRKTLLIEHVAEVRPASRRGADRGENRAPPTTPTLTAIRTAEYVYIEYATGERELYDLRRDPNELTNLAGRVSPDLLRALSERLAVLRGCARAACRGVEDAMAIRLER